MSESRALTELEESLSRGSATPDHGAPDREKFLETERSALRGLVISPREVVAHTIDWVREHGEFDLESYTMVAVAGKDRSWLLFDPSTKEFSLAEGEIEGKLYLVGFKSRDALAEWRG